MDVFRGHKTLMIIGVIAALAVFVSYVGVETEALLDAVEPMFSSTRLTITVVVVSSLAAIFLIVFSHRLETVRWRRT